MKICQVEVKEDGMKRYFDVSADRYVKGKHFSVYRPASLNNPKDHALMFIMKGHLDKKEVFERVAECLIFWPEECEVPETVAQRHAVVKCREPHREFARFFSDNSIAYLPEMEQVDIKNGAFVSRTAKIGSGCRIFPGAYIGGDVELGDDVYIGSGVKLLGEVYIGNHVVIRENTVIGADGLTTDRDEMGKALTIPQFGSVVIEDDVQIGANSVIARGAIDETRICRGSKIDSQAFISHNVTIDCDTFVVGETIMFGSSSVGKRCLISGNSTIMNAVHIGSDSIVGAGAVVTKSVADNRVVKGNPAK